MHILNKLQLLCYIYQCKYKNRIQDYRFVRLLKFTCLYAKFEKLVKKRYNGTDLKIHSLRVKFCLSNREIHVNFAIYFGFFLINF